MKLLLFIILAALVLGGCASQKARSLQLSGDTLEPADGYGQSAALAGWSLLEENDSKSPSVYRRVVSDSAGAAFSVFMTALSECGKAQRTSPSTLLRQLFVGFNRFIIRRKAVHNLASSEVLQWDIEASYEDSNLFVQGYSAFDGGCTFDFVFWAARPTEAEKDAVRAQDFFNTQGNSFAGLVERALRKRLP